MSAMEEFKQSAKKFIEAEFSIKLPNPMSPESEPKSPAAITNFVEASIDGKQGWYRVYVKRLDPAEFPPESPINQ